MEIALILTAIAVTVLLGIGLASRLGMPAPLLLIAIGMIGSVTPGVPEIHLSADVVLLGLLPPLLYAAAMQTSLVDFYANRRAIGLLSVGLVIFTAAGVAVVVKLLLPEAGWPLAFAIGAVVAPPDAVAATAIGRTIGLPRRLVTVLEGESLFNDATALVALRTAIAALAGGIGIAQIGLDFALAAGGGGVIGFVAFLIVAKVRRHLSERPEAAQFDTALSLVTPFAAYLIAEEIHASGVIAVVVAGLLLGHKAPMLQTARSRISERTNWSTIAFVLENTVFLLIGLQADWILEEVFGSPVGTVRIVTISLAVLATVVVLRLAWMLGARPLITGPGREEPPPVAESLLVGWAGMRGVVTLAAAFVIPGDAAYREVVLVTALVVVAGTLFGQGLTLPWLARRLGVRGPDPAEDALARATLMEQAGRAGTERLEQIEFADEHGVAELLRQRVDLRNFAAWERLSTRADGESPSEVYARVRLEMIAAERARVLQARRAASAPAEVIAEVLGVLDVEESMLDAAGEERQQLVADAATRGDDACADLSSHPAVETGEPICEECQAEGLAWVAVRECLDCGHRGCCDSSAPRHATRHFQETGHRVMQSAEPGETWRWCFVHHVTG